MKKKTCKECGRLIRGKKVAKEVKNCFNCRYKPKWRKGGGYCQWFKYNNVPKQAMLIRDVIFKNTKFKGNFNCKCWLGKNDHTDAEHLEMEWKRWDALAKVELGSEYLA